MELKGQIGAGFLFEFFAVLLCFWICGFILFLVLSKLPCNSQGGCQGVTAVTNFSKYAYSFADNSFYVIFVLILFIGLYSAWSNPSVAKAIPDIIGLFVIGYFNLVIANILPTLAVFTPSILTPITYTFFSSAYKVLILYFVMIISIILNARGHK